MCWLGPGTAASVCAAVPGMRESCDSHVIVVIVGEEEREERREKEWREEER